MKQAIFIIVHFNPQENCRFWGEEKEKDAIWGIYLKKVRYQRPSAIVQIVQAGGHHTLAGGAVSGGEKPNGVLSESPEEDSQAEIAHLMWETVRIKVLKAGTLERVVEAVANDDTDVQVWDFAIVILHFSQCPIKYFQCCVLPVPGNAP